jgi:hypothetical protein
MSFGGWWKSTFTNCTGSELMHGIGWLIYGRMLSSASSSVLRSALGARTASFTSARKGDIIEQDKHGSPCLGELRTRRYLQLVWSGWTERHMSAYCRGSAARVASSSIKARRDALLLLLSEQSPVDRLLRCLLRCLPVWSQQQAP